MVKIRKLTDIENMFIRAIYIMVGTELDSLVNANYQFSDSVIEALAIEILQPNPDNHINWVYGEMPEHKLEKVLEGIINSKGDNYKIFSVEQFIKIINHYNVVDGGYACRDKKLRKLTVGRLVKLTDEISEEEYLANINLLSDYSNVIIRENPKLRNSDSIKLTSVLTKKSAIDRLEENSWKCDQGPILKEIDLSTFKKYIDRFSFNKVLDSKSTLEFLIKNTEYFDVLNKHNENYRDNFLMTFVNKYKNIKPDLAESLAKLFGYDNILLTLLENNILEQEYTRTPTGKVKYTYWMPCWGYWNIKYRLEEVNLIINLKVIDNCTHYNDKEKVIAKANINEIKTIFEEAIEESRLGNGVTLAKAKRPKFKDKSDIFKTFISKINNDEK